MAVKAAMDDTMTMEPPPCCHRPARHAHHTAGPTGLTPCRGGPDFWRGWRAVAAGAEQARGRRGTFFMIGMASWDSRKAALTLISKILSH